jgi:hypothetical protein
MPEKTLSIEQVLTMLAAAPERIAEMTGGMTPAQLHTPHGPGEWCANDVLAHLRACADMWGGSIVAIITQDRPTLRAINPRTWIDQTDYLEQAFGPSLKAFTEQRAELMALLEWLPPADWERLATVTGAGKPFEKTVLAYARRLAGHERPHLKQIHRIASAAQTNPKQR